MKTKNFFKLSMGMFVLGQTLKTTKRNNDPLFENYKYNSPFRLPTLSHPAFGEIFIWNKNGRRNNEFAEKKAEQICDRINMMENVDLIPVYAKEGSNTIKIKVKPMNFVKKSFNLQRQIKYVVGNEETRIYPEGDKIVIEIPNSGAKVRLGDFMHDTKFRISDSKTLVPIGQNVEGENIYGDIVKMPHMLVAGATGSGKSVFINGIISALLMKNSPYDLKMILIDPKMVEFKPYSELKYVNYITDTNIAISALSKLCDEMDRRYQIMANAGFRDIESYNKAYPKLRMPRIIMVIDELADMMIGKQGKQVEKNIIRIAQKARASGIHMILATQRPSREVITGLIKANIPCRVCLSVMSRTDSMVVLDQVGAEKLNGHGDLLYLDGLNNKAPQRLQAGLVTISEIHQLVIPLAMDNQPEYADKFDWSTKSPDIREFYGR